MKLTFQAAGCMIDERFFDRGSSDLIADFDFDFVIANGQRNITTVDFGNQRTERLIVGVAQEACQPLRLGVAAHDLAIVIDGKVPRLSRFNRNCCLATSS